MLCQVHNSQYFRAKLQFKYQKYTRGWAVGWVVFIGYTDPTAVAFLFAVSAEGNGNDAEAGPAAEEAGRGKER